MTLIQAVDLTKRFGDQLAVDRVSLGVGRGEVVGFLGPNGAGKSTTMRMITGFLEPDAGTSAICGHDVASDPIAAKRHLGYLPEGAPGYADMTVSDFLTFIGKIRGLDATKLNDRLAEMVERIRLTEVWNKPIDTLSKGFKRRVGIAQALIHDPDVLILDEPTDGLDPNQKYEMRSLISGISAEKAIVISTHILEEVEAICSRAVIIAEGRVVADATPDELIERATRPSAIRVTVASTETDDIVARIKPVAGTEHIEVMERFNGSTRVLVDVGEDQNETADFARAVRDTGLVVEEVARHRPRLEDVFRDITRSDRAS